MPSHMDNTSLETILTIDNKPSDSEWSEVWSTEHVPVMDRGTGAKLNHIERLLKGRKRLRYGALAIGGLMTMHCRVTATMLTGGFFMAVLMVTAAVVVLGNPLRHFEVYLGQWSISGPGRAFRIIPAFDGIGIAICANALVRAILCATIAAIAAIYVWHAISDHKLPFTYCRNFKLEPYNPIVKSVYFLRGTKRTYGEGAILVGSGHDTTVGMGPHAWRNISRTHRKNIPGVVIANNARLRDVFDTLANTRFLIIRQKSPIAAQIPFRATKEIKVCEETFSSTYPPLYRTPAYNYFYVELMRLHPDYSMKDFNFQLLGSIVMVYSILWAFMIYERVIYKRIIFNNTWPMIISLPWIWTVCILAVSINLYAINTKPFKWMLRLSSSAKSVTGTISDVLQVSLYLHSASTGSTILLGKGLNHYAAGHIDSKLNNENVWHSVTLLLLTVLSSGGASLCALIDHYEHKNAMFKNIYESTLWTLPMYSSCTSKGSYSHFWTAIIFMLLTLSYMIVAFDHLKTALHTIFEYRVKLVFVEQLVVASTLLGCMWCSFLFATNGGIPTLESTEAIITGVATPLICLLELAGLLYAYGGRDFVSDMNAATEDNTCATRMNFQWQFIPLVTLITLIMKIISVALMEMPSPYTYIAIVPLLVIVLSVPLRAIHNACVFLRPAPRHGT